MKGALGLYDSGIGGKTVLNEIRKIFPNIEVHYLADTKNLPLGSKSRKEIIEAAKKGVEFLFNKGCVLVIIACNTASVNSIRFLQQKWLKKHFPDRNILGVSIPLLEHIKENYYHSNDSNIVILSTPSTHKNGFYLNKIKTLGFKNANSIPCRDLAKTIELGNKNEIKLKIQEIYKNFNHSNDYYNIVLACTHYPLALKQFKKVFPKNTVFIDQSKATAEKLKLYLKKHKEYKLKRGIAYFWSNLK